MEDQIESDSSELKKLKTEENSLKRLGIVKKEKLATTRFRINKKQEDVKQYKQTVIEYGPDAGQGLRMHKESREAFKVKNSASSDYDVITLSGFFRLFVCLFVVFLLVCDFLRHTFLVPLCSSLKELWY